MKRYALNILISLDQLVNALAAGDPDETISSRAGKAARKGVLWGCLLCRLLDRLEKDHCNSSIEPDRGDKV